MAILGNAEGSTLKGKINKLTELRGYSAYEIAVINGFEGTEEEWLESLKPYNLTEEEKAEIAHTIEEEKFGDLDAAIDAIIAMQNSLLLKTFKLNDGGVITTYKFESGMTWGEWVASEYNTDGFFCEGFGMVQDTHSKGYIHKTMEINNVYQNDAIEAEYEYYLHW